MNLWRFECRVNRRSGTSAPVSHNQSLPETKPAKKNQTGCSRNSTAHTENFWELGNVVH
jgi:hypothetical protein